MNKKIKNSIRNLLTKIYGLGDIGIKKIKKIADKVHSIKLSLGQELKKYRAKFDRFVRIKAEEGLRELRGHPRRQRTRSNGNTSKEKWHF